MPSDASQPEEKLQSSMTPRLWRIAAVLLAGVTVPWARIGLWRAARGLGALFGWDLPPGQSALGSAVGGVLVLGLCSWTAVLAWNLWRGTTWARRGTLVTLIPMAISVLFSIAALSTPERRSDVVEVRSCPGGRIAGTCEFAKVSWWWGGLLAAELGAVTLLLLSPPEAPRWRRAPSPLPELDSERAGERLAARAIALAALPVSRDAAVAELLMMSRSEWSVLEGAAQRCADLTLGRESERDRLDSARVLLLEARDQAQ